MTMAADEAAGAARRATKSKLFEFLVHGVVSMGRYDQVEVLHRGQPSTNHLILVSCMVYLPVTERNSPVCIIYSLEPYVTYNGYMEI